MDDGLKQQRKAPVVTGNNKEKVALAPADDADGVWVASVAPLRSDIVSAER